YFNGPLSNSELSKQLSLSTPKINSLLIELLEDGLIRDLGRGDSSGGRRPNSYGLVREGFYMVGITINITRTIISIFNSNNEEVRGPHYLPIQMQSDFYIFNRVIKKLEEEHGDSNIQPDKNLAAAIDLPGLVNLKKGVNKNY